MFPGVPKSVLLASLLGLIPILTGLISTFNIGLSESTKEGFIEIALIYSGFILSFVSGCAFYVSSLERERVLLLWFSILPVLLALLSIIISFMQSFVLALGFLVVLQQLVTETDICATFGRVNDCRTKREAKAVIL